MALKVRELKMVLEQLDDECELFIVTNNNGCVVEELCFAAGSNPDVYDLKDITGLYFYGDVFND